MASTPLDPVESVTQNCANKQDARARPLALGPEPNRSIELGPPPPPPMKSGENLIRATVPLAHISARCQQEKKKLTSPPGRPRERFSGPESGSRPKREEEEGAVVSGAPPPF